MAFCLLSFSYSHVQSLGDGGVQLGTRRPRLDGDGDIGVYRSDGISMYTRIYVHADRNRHGVLGGLDLDVGRGELPRALLHGLFDLGHGVPEKKGKRGGVGERGGEVARY